MTFLDGVAGRNSQEKDRDSLKKGFPQFKDWNNDKSSNTKQQKYVFLEITIHISSFEVHNCGLEVRTKWCILVGHQMSLT